jgi:hypothetical protein
VVSGSPLRWLLLDELAARCPSLRRSNRELSLLLVRGIIATAPGLAEEGEWMGSTVRLLPSWVESDPLRDRAIDALGLQSTADRVADVLLPGLSVLTTHARYYAMLAWARRACGSRADEGLIHRLEVALAVRSILGTVARSSDAGTPDLMAGRARRGAEQASSSSRNLSS